MKIGHVNWLINRVQELELEVNDWKDEAIKWNKRFEDITKEGDLR